MPPALRREVEVYAQLLHARGYVANHDGNVSARLSPEGRFLISPTAVSKRLVDREALAVCAPDGAPEGRIRPPSEVALHVAAYRARPDAQAVIHAHPVQASAFALAGRPIEPIGMPEVVVSLGPRIPLLPAGLPRQPAILEALAQALGAADVVLLGGNGVLAVGDTLEQAYLRVELVEHYAAIHAAATALGGARPLPEAVHAEAVEAHRKLRPPPRALDQAGPGDRRSAEPGALGPAGYGARTERGAVDATARVREAVADEVRRALGDRR